MTLAISCSQALEKLEEYLIDSTTEGFPLEYLKIIKKETICLEEENDRLEEENNQLEQDAKNSEPTDLQQNAESAENVGRIYEEMMQLDMINENMSESIAIVKNLCDKIV